MYRGDGSYKAIEYKPEKSLLELLQAEQELVGAYNTKVVAFTIMKKSSIRYEKSKREVDEAYKKLVDIRKQIRVYLESNLDMLSIFKSTIDSK